MKEIIQNTARWFMSQVEFSPESHTYVRKSDGKFLAGTTEICGLLPKEWAIPYGAKEAVKALGYFEKIDGEQQIDDWSALENIRMYISGCSDEEYYKLLHNAKGAPGRKSKDAMSKGTDMHAWVEEYVKAKIRGQMLPALPTGWQERPAQELVKWFDENVEEFYLSEALVCDPENEYAGTLDILGKLKTGEIAVMDIKLANNIGKDYFLQTAAYMNALVRRGVPVVKRILLRLPKTEYLTKYDTKKFTYTKVENNFEAVVVPTDFEYDFQTFLKLREMYRWYNYAKKYA